MLTPVRFEMFCQRLACGRVSKIGVVDLGRRYAAEQCHDLIRFADRYVNNVGFRRRDIAAKVRIEVSQVLNARSPMPGPEGSGSLNPEP